MSEFPKRTLYFQSVKLTLSDGREGYFTGPMLVGPELAGLLTVVRVEFNPPKKLPKDTFWEALEANEEK